MKEEYKSFALSFDHVVKYEVLFAMRFYQRMEGLFHARLEYKRAEGICVEFYIPNRNYPEPSPFLFVQCITSNFIRAYHQLVIGHL
ncbi:hypothetical protein RRF57_009700 [Xylaria bambusicola]|uniref:Uncharacterized protein n=1 Tax=Xylaria bambusicola TaxID=326684 RepID=A0AAN7UX78_9PEZI